MEISKQSVKLIEKMIDITMFFDQTWNINDKIEFLYDEFKVIYSKLEQASDIVEELRDKVNIQVR